MKKILKIHFSPSLFSVMLTVFAIFLTIRLGSWQLHRAYEKEQMLLRYRQGSEKIKWIDGREKGLKQYQQVALKGSFLNQDTFFLDNQYYKHQIGYDVVTPFKLNNGIVLLVDRGWVKAPVKRRELPEISSIRGIKTIRGKVYYPANSWVLGNIIIDSKGKKHWRVQKLDIKLLSTKLRHSFLPFVVRLDSDTPGAYICDWQIVSMAPSRHKAYALQWFTFSLIAGILFFIFAIKPKSKYDTV